MRSLPWLIALVIYFLLISSLPEINAVYELELPSWSTFTLPEEVK